MNRALNRKIEVDFMEKVIEVIIGKCVACHSCELACSLAHSKSKDLMVAIREKDKTYPRIILERDAGDVIPFHCRHCTEAPCITVCPTQAMFRLNELSPIILDKAKCIGCNACVIVCPFGVIKKGSDGKSLIKCDLCIERLREGEEPACAEACPTHAIRYISTEQISEERRKDALQKYRVAFIQNSDGGADIG